MKKDRNNIDPLPSAYTLPRSKILRGRKNFQRLFEKAAFIKKKHVGFRFRIYNKPDENCLVGFVVSKKLGKASVRNKAKRRMREIYRLNQSVLNDLFSMNSFGFHGVFIAFSTDADFHILEPEMIEILNETRQRICKLRNLSCPDNQIKPNEQEDIG